MKRVPGIIVRFLLVFFISWMTLCLPADAEVMLQCAEVTYLELGREGMVSCNLEPFYAVSWYTKEDYDANGSPLIYFNEDKNGLLGEYDAYPNGSFIIRNVSLDHAGSYIVAVLQDARSTVIVSEVHVEVYAIPYPTYPVVDGYISQQHVYKDVNRYGELSCSMRGVYPSVNLTWTFVDPNQRSKIQFQHGVMGRTRNEDKTFDVTLSSLYQVTDQSVKRITIWCEVATEIGEVFSKKTKVDLLFSAGHPVVNGYDKHQHVYLDTEREGHLTCSKKSERSDASLVWEVLDATLKDKITIHSDTIRRNNEDNTVDINVTSHYIVSDNSIDRITIQCKETGPSADEHPSFTVVDLIFPAIAPTVPPAPVPVIDGCYSQKDHCQLKVQRKGDLTCSVKNSHQPIDLQLNILKGLELQQFFSLKEQRYTSSNKSGTFQVSMTTPFNVINESLDSLNVECGAFTAKDGTLTASSRVLLLFEGVPVLPADPPHVVIDGCFSQGDHCELEVESKGTLMCSVKNSPYMVDLKWKSTVDDPSRVTFQDEKTVITKHFGDTFDQSATVSYTLAGSFLKEGVKVVCEAYEHESDILFSRSSVRLNVKNANDPHINSISTKLDCLLLAVVVNITISLAVMLCVLMLTLGKVRKRKKLHWTKKNHWRGQLEHNGSIRSRGSNVSNRDSEQAHNLLPPQDGATSTNKGLTEIILGIFQKLFEKYLSSESDIEALLGNEVRSEHREGHNSEMKDETKM